MAKFADQTAHEARRAAAYAAAVAAEAAARKAAAAARQAQAMREAELKARAMKNNWVFDRRRTQKMRAQVIEDAIIL